MTGDIECDIVWGMIITITDDEGTVFASHTLTAEDARVLRQILDGGSVGFDESNKPDELLDDVKAACRHFGKKEEA